MEPTLHHADRLLPLYRLIAGGIRASHYIRVDESPVRCLEPGTGKTAPGYFWVYHHDEHGVLFDWQKSRANPCLDNILVGGDGEESFSGRLQCDGLRVYRAFIDRHPGLVHHPRLLPLPHRPQIQGSPRRASPHLKPASSTAGSSSTTTSPKTPSGPVKLGHENWMFIGGEHTGWRSAVICTFVDQFRRHGKDPFAYFE